MISLLDVNVLVALAWPNHIHHEAAHHWFAEQSRHAERAQTIEPYWATCPITETGFVRVSSNPSTTPEARNPGEAIALLELMMAQPGHVFWPDDVSPARDELVPRERIVGHRQVTDAHLLSLAMRRGGRLATFDRAVLQLVPGSRDPEDVVEVLG